MNGEGPNSKVWLSAESEAGRIGTKGTRHVLARLALVAGSLAISLAMLEVALRIGGYAPSYADPTMYSLTDDGRRYGLSANWSGWYGGVWVRTNNLGLRGPELPPTKGADEYRVVVLGDSVVFGQGVREENTLSVKLEALLKPSLPSKRVVVINAGVPGYNTTTQREQLKRLWPVLRPDLVVLAYLVDNDSDVDTGIKVDPRTGALLTGFHYDSPLSRGSYFLHRHSRLYSFVRHRIRSFQEAADAREGGAPQNMFSSDNQGWQESQRALLEMSALCNREHVPFVVGLLGLVFRIQGADIVSAFSAQNGIRSVELWRTTDVKRFFEQYAVASYDGHPNSRAHELMALRLAAYVRASIQPDS